MQLPMSTSWPVHTDQDAEDLGPVTNQREHSKNCMITSKTSSEHATADFDDERGRNFIGQEAGMNGPSNLHSCTAVTCLCSKTRMSNTLSMNRIRGISNPKNSWTFVAAWSQEGKSPAQYLCTALGWRYRSSPRRKRREVKRGDTRVPVPVPDPSLLIPFAVPHDLDTSWSTPDSTVSYVCSRSRSCQRGVP